MDNLVSRWGDTLLSAAPTSLAWVLKNTNPKVQIHIEAFVKRVVESLLHESRESQIIPKKVESYTWPHNLWELKELISISLGLIEEMWQDKLAQSGIHFKAPKLVVYEGKTMIWKIEHRRDMWPCYDPNSETLYLDPLFFEDFRQDIYPGCEDASILMVLAHEMSHYIQDLYFEETQVKYMHEGILHTRDLYSVLDLANFSLYHHFDSAHQASQIVELHADFLTGVCLRHIHMKHRDVLHEDDFFEVVHTASLIGDDILQMLAGKPFTPESYKHGRFDQRVLALAEWFILGNPYHFTLQDIAQIFFREGVLRPAHESVDMFHLQK